MEKNEMPADAGGHEPVISLDRHSPVYRTEFQQLSDELHAKCPVAWNDTADQPHWYASGNKELFDLARRADLLSNDNDLEGVRKGYRGVMVPAAPPEYKSHAGFLEMDPPDQRYYRQALNPYLSPAAN
jgi:cytochrome P450